MKKVILSITLVITTVLLLTASTYAQPMRMSGKKGPNRPMIHKMEIMKKLNLTDQQKEKIADLRLNFQKQMIDLKADLQKSRLDLKDLRLKNDITRNDVVAAVEKVNKKRDAISLAMANHMVDIYQILTPEQQKIARENAPMFLGMRKHMGMMRRGMRFNR